MKKIAFFSRDLNIGGMEKALINLLNELCNYYEVNLFLLEKKGELINFLDKRVIIREYTISQNKFVLFRKLTNFTKRLIFTWKYKNKFSFSCNYATYSIPCSHLALITSSNSSIYIHSDYSGVYKNDFKSIKNFLDGVLITKFKSVFCVSNESEKSIKKIYPEINYFVLGNIVNHDEILKLAEEKIDIEIDGKLTNLLFVGRFEEESKNIMLLLNVFKKLDSNYNLYLIGDGPSKDLYQKFVIDKKIADRVFFLGYKSNPYPYINKCSFVILTSNYEGFPVVFQEAFVLKKQLISTVKVSDELVDSSNYINYISGSADEIAEQIKMINIIKENNIDYKLINKKRIETFKSLIEKE